MTNNKINSHYLLHQDRIQTPCDLPFSLPRIRIRNSIIVALLLLSNSCSLLETNDPTVRENQEKNSEESSVESSVLTDQDSLIDQQIFYLDDPYQARRGLRYPPDLTVNDEFNDQQLLSKYTIDDLPAAQSILDFSDIGIEYISEGNLNYLVVNKSLSESWSVLRQFWLNLGFTITEEFAQIGLLKTNWRTQTERLDGSGLTGVFDRAFSRFYDTGQRDRFVMTVDEREGQIFVFVSYSGIREVYDIRSSESGNSKYATLPSNPGIEKELLKRLMLYLSNDPEFVDEQVAKAQTGSNIYSINDGLLLINRAYANSFSTIQRAILRAGFSIEQSLRDVNRIKIKFVPLKREIALSDEAQKESDGLLDFLFDEGEIKVIPKIYTVTITDLGSRTEVTIDGLNDAVSIETAEDILKQIATKL